MGQTADSSKPSLPKDPREVFAAAAPLYDFSDPALKPWHLKATYQLYDEKGNPAEKGTFEYWWASPQVHRSTWTRPSATMTFWHTADGKSPVQSSGERGDRVEYVEEKLRDALVSPLPTSADLDPAKGSLYIETKSENGNTLSCIMLVPLLEQVAKDQKMPLGLFPTYCFDPQGLELRAMSSFANPMTVFDSGTKMQDRFLPRNVQIFEGQAEVLSAKVDSVTYIDATDPALTPTEPLDKFLVGSLVGQSVVTPVLDSRVEPIYPLAAKVSRITGTVVLKGMITKDGSVRNLRVISAPCVSLAESALTAVSQWRYRPALLNDKPVAMMTTINVKY